MTMRAATVKTAPASDGERSLIDRARKLDAEAWDELYTEHHPAIFRYVYLRTNDHGTAEDLAAEVFVQAVRSIKRYRYRGLAFRAWLYRIAHNLTAEHHRRARRAGTGPRLPAEAELVEEADFAGQVVDRRALLTALGRLTAEQQQVVILRFFEGLSLPEVSEATGRRVGAVKAMQRRALQRMRVILEEGN